VGIPSKIDMTIASAAKPGAAGRHEGRDDRKRGEAGRGGSS
jgi:hypothetical protein